MSEQKYCAKTFHLDFTFSVPNWKCETIIFRASVKFTIYSAGWQKRQVSDSGRTRHLIAYHQLFLIPNICHHHAIDVSGTVSLFPIFTHPWAKSAKFYQLPVKHSMLSVSRQKKNHSRSNEDTLLSHYYAFIYLLHFDSLVLRTMVGRCFAIWSLFFFLYYIIFS